MRSIILFSVLFLSACGGGGGDNSASNNSGSSVAPPSLSISAGASNPVTENSKGSISVTYQNASGVVSLAVSDINTNVSSAAVSVKADSNQKSVTVEVAELVRDGQVSFTVTGTDASGKSDNANVTVSLTNTSVNAVLGELALLQTELPNLLDVTQGRAVLDRMNEVAILTGIKTTSDVAAQSISTDPDLKTKLETALVGGDFSSRYSSGELDESSLISIVDTALTDLAHYSQGVYAQVVEVQGELGGNMFAPVTETASFTIDTDKSTVSQFWGNDRLGSTHGAQWQFNDSFAYLEAIVFPESLPCNAE